ncbi:MarR family winged helix-turn-helix transcriptional regulator [Chitinibacteraceae bacterium HSL-7]
MSAEWLLLQQMRRITHSAERYSKRLGLRCQVTMPQLNCLYALASEPQLSVKALSRLVALSPSTVVGILDRLEARGWVTRIRNPHDRRQVDVALTASGRDALAGLPSAWQPALTVALDALDERERQLILATLGRIADWMEADPALAGDQTELTTGEPREIHE